jgi:pyridoxamine 5'-phosphate oxidase
MSLDFFLNFSSERVYDPFEIFSQELKKAVDLKMPEPTAFSLATVGVDGMPNVRTLLFKGLSEKIIDDKSLKSFTFYTNYQSEKAEQLESGKAGMLFFWPTLAQQIRIEGFVEKVTRKESEDYFNTRPRLSQIGAWASQQSKEIPNPEFLQKQVTDIEKRFENQPVPCPPNWGGYRLIPLSIEFWFGREGRLHDRFVFERKDFNQPWRQFMKSP